MTVHKKRWSTRSNVDDDFKRASNLRKSFSDGIRAFEKRSCEEDYYRWKIQNNPVQTGILQVATDNDMFIGMLSAIPRRVFVKRDLRNGAEICDAFVHNDYQRQGIFSTLVNLTCENALQNKIEFIYTTPIEHSNSLSGFEKCNFLQIPSVNVLNLVCPFNIIKIIQTQLQLSFVPNFISAMIDPFAAFIYKSIYSVKSLNRIENNLRIFSVSSFSDEIYKLYKKVSANYDWIVERSMKYLNWRFIKNPDDYSVWLVQDNQETLGYVVLKYGIWKNLKVGYIVDYLTDEERPDVFTKLILHTLSLFRKAKVDMVSSWAVKNSYYYKTLKTFGFQKYNKIVIVCYPNEIGKQLAGQQLKWHFTMADSDNI